MKFVQFYYKNDLKNVRVGILEGEQVIDLNKSDLSLPTTLIEIIKGGHVEKANKLNNPVTTPLNSVILTAPLHGMDKVLCVGLNYKDHCKEQNFTPPAIPFIFNKFPSSVIGQDKAVKLRPEVSTKVVCEVELTIVIGKEASLITADEAYDHVFGYTIAQDIGATDWEKNDQMGQLLLGKAMDTFCPIGPCVVTSDEVGDPQMLDIKCSVNGVQKQSSNTNQFIHKIPDVIARLSRAMTLLPGDIILTGTPGGVGVFRNPPEFLQPGDVITSEVEKIGVLYTRVENL
ncbi:Fumarylacetoacetate hydrolase isoform A [Operophtera brumata]|uniref:Fumarylacetoacetate hydrolase isoform A n=1 Tax=Operophtera brumata TaxID=104452 RepID=A0A0L7L322_OPEBR|nr:Fumarylacetoacetate hydrolase isoform A [Operophtera brumata]